MTRLLIVNMRVWLAPMGISTKYKAAAVAADFSTE
jgi:hypothetical protein